MGRKILDELIEHIPFTALGAASGIAIVVVIVLADVLPQAVSIAPTLFEILHPAHVLLSAIVITALSRKHSPRRLWAAIVIGYLGAVVIGTVSDSLVPYLGEALLDLPNRSLHIGFIEEWWLVNPAALAGVAIGLLRPNTRVPHSAHILISTWASLFHIIMALGAALSWVTVLAIFALLFIAVWLPCCFSDIVFPVLLAREVAPPERHPV